MHIGRLYNSAKKSGASFVFVQKRWGFLKKLRDFDSCTASWQVSVNVLPQSFFHSYMNLFSMLSNRITATYATTIRFYS